MSINITAIMFFHQEGSIATTSILSLMRLVEFAGSSGLGVKKIAVLDRPNDETQSIVTGFEGYFDYVMTVDRGDLGAARNAGIEQCEGEYVAIFDGDDLWGRSWLARSYTWFKNSNTRNAILHPKLVHYFSSADYLAQSRDHTVSPNTKSFHFVHVDSSDTGFDKRAIYFNNLWTSNTFAPVEVYRSFPYREINPASGFGVEDWTWNAETLSAGIRHAVVEDTVHCVRLKESNSLGMQNSRKGLLPPLQLFSSMLEFQ